MLKRGQVLGNEVSISYVVDGPEDAPVVMLVHGGSLDADSWAEVMDVLSGNYRVYAVDMRGHGHSSWTKEYSYELLADDISAFIDALRLTEVILIGHSLGGTAAMLTAQRQPVWLSCLILEEPAILRPGLEQVPAPEASSQPLSWDRNTLIGPIIAQRNDPDPAWWHRLRDIKAPTLMLVGSTAPTPAQQDMIDAAELIPDSQVAAINVGHHIHRNARNEFLDTVKNFISELPRVCGLGQKHTRGGRPEGS